MLIPRFIFIEGADNVGKTTLINELKERYKNNNVDFLKFPTENCLKEIEKYEKFIRENELSDTLTDESKREQFFYYKLLSIIEFINDILWSMMIRYINKDNKIELVICDRSLLSTYVYNVLYLEQKVKYNKNKENFESFIEYFKEEMNFDDKCYSTKIQINIIRFIYRSMDYIRHIIKDEDIKLTELHKNNLYEEIEITEKYTIMYIAFMDIFKYVNNPFTNYVILNNNLDSTSVTNNDNYEVIDDESYRGRIDKDKEYQEFITISYNTISKYVDPKTADDSLPILCVRPESKIISIDIFDTDDGNRRKTTDEIINDLILKGVIENDIS